MHGQKKPKCTDQILLIGHPRQLDLFSVAAMKIRKLLVALLLCTFAVADAHALSRPIPNQNAVVYSADKYTRTELYFGRSLPDGSTISEAEWTKFLNDVVTPRFPDGFTVLDGFGQYRDKSGRTVKEPSKVIVFLYSRRTQKTSSTKIDEIRAAYVKLFSQESVLRLDFRSSVNVNF